MRAACQLCKVRRADRHTLGRRARGLCVQAVARIRLNVQLLLRCGGRHSQKQRPGGAADAVGGSPLARNGACWAARTSKKLIFITAQCACTVPARCARPRKAPYVQGRWASMRTGAAHRMRALAIIYQPLKAAALLFNPGNAPVRLLPAKHQQPENTPGTASPAKPLCAAASQAQGASTW